MLKLVGESVKLEEVGFMVGKKPGHVVDLRQN